MAGFRLSLDVSESACNSFVWKDRSLVGGKNKVGVHCVLNCTDLFHGSLIKINFDLTLESST